VSIFRGAFHAASGYGDRDIQSGKKAIVVRFRAVKMRDGFDHAGKAASGIDQLSPSSS